MADPTLMDVLNSAYELLVDAYRSFLVQALVLHDVIEKLTIDAVLHDQVQLRLSLDYLVSNRKIKLCQYSSYSSSPFLLRS